MKTIVHVNQAVIKTNIRKELQEPVLTVKQGKNNTYAMEVDILGPCKVIYSPDKPYRVELGFGLKQSQK